MGKAQSVGPFVYFGHMFSLFTIIPEVILPGIHFLPNKDSNYAA